MFLFRSAFSSSMRESHEPGHGRTASADAGEREDAGGVSTSGTVSDARAAVKPGPSGTSQWVDGFGFRLNLSVRQRRKYELRVKMATAQWDTLVASRGATPSQFRELLLGARHGALMAAGAPAGTACVPHDDVVDLVQRHGVAPHFRAHVWRVWAHVDEFMKQAERPYEWYAERINELPTAVDRQIEVDLERTFPEHPNFRPGQPGFQSLRRVLGAYALFNAEVGYLQSMNFVAAFLLLVFEACESDAFWALHRIVSGSLQGYFHIGMPALQADSAVFDHLLRVHHGDLYQHLEDIGFTMDVVLPRWFLCVYLTNFPAEIAVRVWDCVLCAQDQAPRVLIMIALALMEIYKPRLMECHDFISAALLLQTAGSSVDDVNDLLTTAFDAVGVGAVAEVSITALRHLARDFVPPKPATVPELAASPVPDPALSNPFSPLPWGAVRGDPTARPDQLQASTAVTSGPVAPSGAPEQAARADGATAKASTQASAASTAGQSGKRTAGAPASSPSGAVRRVTRSVAGGTKRVMMRGASPRSPATPMSCGSGGSITATPLRHAVLVAAAMAASSPSWVSPEPPTPGRATARAVRGSARRRALGKQHTPVGGVAATPPTRTPTRRASVGSPAVRASPLAAIEVGLFGSPVSWRGDRNSASLHPSPASSRVRRRSSVGRLSASSFGSPASLPSTAAQHVPRAMASAGPATRRRSSIGPSSRPAVSSRLAPGSASNPYLAAAARARRRRRMSLNTPRASARSHNPQRPAVDLFGGLESPTPSVTGSPTSTTSAEATGVRSAGPRLRHRSTLMAQLVSPTARRGGSRSSARNTAHAPSPLAARARVGTPSAVTGGVVAPGWCDASLSPASGHPLTGSDGESADGSAPRSSGRENVEPAASGTRGVGCTPAGVALGEEAGCCSVSTAAVALVSTPGRRAGEVIELAMLSPVSRTPRKNSRLLDFVTSPRGYQTGSAARRRGKPDAHARTPARSCGRKDVPRSLPRKVGSANRRVPTASNQPLAEAARASGAATAVAPSPTRGPSRAGVRVALRF